MLPQPPRPIEYIRQVLPSPHTPPSVIVILLCCFLHAPSFSLTFVVNLISTYAHMLLSPNITLSPLPPYFPSLLLPCGCNVTSVSSHHPTIHLYSVITSFFLPSLHSLVTSVGSDDHLHWNGITFAFLFPFFFGLVFTWPPYEPALHRLYFASDCQNLRKF